jgi:hypothetical protein
MKKITIINSATASDLVGMGILQTTEARKSVKTGWLTVAQFLTLQGLSATHGERILLGLELSKLARIKGIKLPEKQPGYPTAYPVALLSIAINPSKA